MTGQMNEINIDHINHLTDIDLSKLLHTLIHLEAKKFNLEEWDASVPFNITTADAGSDGRVNWNGNPAKTNWFPKKFVIFQNKATDLPPGECYEEILEKEKPSQPRQLKSQIKKLVEQNGCYILFTNRPIVDNGKEKRIAEFRRAIKDAGHANHDTFEIRVYDSNKIKDWVNEFIAAVTLVQGLNGIHRPQGFVDWDKWNVLSKAHETNFQIDDVVKNNMTLIESSITKEKVIRVTGHSGIGKTRLVFESFRNSSLKKSLVYLDLEGSENINELRRYILSHQDTQEGIIVVDNCDSRSHQILSGIAKPTGSIRLVTLGLDDIHAIQDLKIKLDRDNQRNLVKDIVTAKIGSSHNPSDIEYITTISEGYPWMAIRFCEVVLKEGMSELNKIPLETFVKRLIFGVGQENEIEYSAIRACSVFSAFGFLDDSFTSVINPELKETLKAQVAFIRQRIFDGTITETKFNEVCNKFLKEDILERRGIFYVVKPTILAINLAADWLTNTNSDKIIQIIKDLKQVNLEEKFVDRLKDLDQIDKAKDIVAELWGPNSPFGTAEVLNSSWGSLLFRYVVEVNPIATTKGLEASFGGLSVEQLSGIEEGRRNLVWALEKLVFRKETFGRACKILFSFAAAENESWGNNATGQFVQLFQIFLPGTEANLDQRIEIIDWGLSKKNDAYTKVAIAGLGRGLLNDHFSRGGGPEKQGSGAPLVDYKPQTWGEIYLYWGRILTILTDIACSSDRNSNFAKEKIHNAIRSLIRAGQIELVSKSISKITDKHGNYWPDALSALKTTLHFDKPSDKIKEQINSIIELLTPRDLKNQLLLKVSKPEWDSYEKDDEGQYIDKPYLNAIAFAEKVVQENEPWVDHLDELLKGEQRQCFSFGRRIGQLSTDADKIIDKAIDVLKLIPPEMQNPELIGGLIVGYAKREVFEKSVAKFIVEDSLRHHSFYLTRIFQPSLSDINRLFDLVDKYNVSIYSFLAFQYGRSLSNLDNSELIEFCKRLAGYGLGGRWVALSILFMHCYGNDSNWKSCKDYVQELVSGDNLLLVEDNPNRLNNHQWSETVIKLLKESVDSSFALQISKQIVEACSKFKLISLDSFASNAIRILVEKYFVETWEVFGSGLLGDFITFFKLKDLLGSKRGWLGANGIIFDSGDRTKVILEWCAKYPTIAPKRIANMMPLEMKIGEQIEWHPFAKEIINTYGDLDGLLEEISANMGTFGMTGSSIPYYNDQKQLLLKIKDHPNPTVRDWVDKMVEYTERKIKREQLDEESGF